MDGAPDSTASRSCPNQTWGNPTPTKTENLSPDRPSSQRPYASQHTSAPNPAEGIRTSRRNAAHSAPRPRLWQQLATTNHPLPRPRTSQPFPKSPDNLLQIAWDPSSLAQTTAPARADTPRKSQSSVAPCPKYLRPSECESAAPEIPCGF